MHEPAAAANRISSMWKILVAVTVLASCSSGEEQRQGSGNQSAAAEQPAPKAGAAPAKRRLTRLAGLYEGGKGDPKHQMCILDERGGKQSFGLVVWGSNMHSCAGTGTATREGDVLKLSMAGDSACTIEATISGTTVTMPQAVPQGCSYYCGAQAKLSGAALTQVGTTEADAMKAKDLVGEPLCEAESG